MSADRHLSYEQFQDDCQTLVTISDELGESWRLCRSDSVTWLELQQLRTLETDDDEVMVQCLYQVHYSVSYAVPVLLCRFSHMSGEMIDYETVRRRILSHGLTTDTGDPKPGVTTDMVSMAPHPVTGLPWLQVHPCKTADTLMTLQSHRNNNDDNDDNSDDSDGLLDQDKCNTVISFLSFYGQALGLHMNPRFATTKVN